MSEKTISIESFHPLDIFGANDRNMEIIRDAFPKLKIVVRDNAVKAFGEESDLLEFEEKFTSLLHHYERFNRLTVEDIAMLLASSNGDGSLQAEGPNAEVL